MEVSEADLKPYSYNSDEDYIHNINYVVGAGAVSYGQLIKRGKIPHNQDLPSLRFAEPIEPNPLVYKTPYTNFENYQKQCLESEKRNLETKSKGTN